MTNKPSIKMAKQITAVRREIDIRKRFYPKKVAERRLSQERADSQIAEMEAVLDSLEGIGNAAYKKAEASLFEIPAQDKPNTYGRD